MLYKIRLIDLITRDEATIEQTFEREDHVTFQWLENNYCCDCNRSLFLYTYNKEKELPCNVENPNQILVEIWEAETGKRVASEMIDELVHYRTQAEQHSISELN